jgi:hypothetical protein
MILPDKNCTDLVQFSGVVRATGNAPEGQQIEGKFEMLEKSHERQ